MHPSLRVSFSGLGALPQMEQKKNDFIAPLMANQDTSSGFLKPPPLTADFSQPPKKRFLYYENTWSGILAKKEQRQIRQGKDSRLMDENYEELFQRIRAKCRQQRWHGPDGSNPFEIVKQERIRQEKELERIRQSVQNGRTFVVRSSSTRYWYDRNRKQYAINLDTDLDNCIPLAPKFLFNQTGVSMDSHSP